MEQNKNQITEDLVSTNKASDISDLDYHDETLNHINKKNNKNLNVNKNINSDTKLAKKKSESLLIILILFVLIVGVILILIPSPLRSMFSTNNSSTDNNTAQNYELPNVCKILDSETAKKIINQDLNPSNETKPSTSTITCTYSNKEKTKGLSLIARKFADINAAKANFESIKQINENNQILTQTSKSLPTVIVAKTNESYVIKDKYNFILQYIGFENNTNESMIKDLDMIIANI